MIVIRLKRIGRRNDPSFRVIVTEKSRGPKSGDYIEKLGFYNPQDDTVDLNKERIEHWLSVGAQPSDTVHNLLVSAGIITGKKINVLPQKSPVVTEEEEKKEEPATDEEKSEETPAEESAEETSETETTEESTPEEKEEKPEEKIETPDTPEEETKEE